MRLRIVLIVVFAVFWAFAGIGCPIEYPVVDIAPSHKVTGLKNPRNLSVITIGSDDFLFVCDINSGIYKIPLTVANSGILATDDKTTAISTLNGVELFEFKTAENEALYPVDFDVFDGYMFVVLRSLVQTDRYYLRKIDIDAAYANSTDAKDFKFLDFPASYVSVNENAVFISGVSAKSAKAFLIDKADSYAFLDTTTDMLKTIADPGRILASSDNWIYITDKTTNLTKRGVRAIRFDTIKNCFDATDDYLMKPSNLFFSGMEFDSTGKLYGISANGLSTFNLATDNTTDTEFNKLSKASLKVDGDYTLNNIFVTGTKGYCTYGYGVLVIDSINTASPVVGKNIVMGSRYDPVYSTVWVNDTVIYNNGTKDFLISTSQRDGTLIITDPN